MGKKYGYVRVSTREQCEDRQLNAMAELGIEKNNVYIDKQSGKDFKRPQYQKLLRKLKENDVLFIKSIDRMGRNYEEIIDQWRIITKEIKADVVVLDMPLLDTRNKSNGLTGKFVADMVLQILSYVAQTEREFIRQRQREGIEAAKARGVKFGARQKPLPEEFSAIKKRCENGEISLREGARILKMSYSSFYRHYNMQQAASESRLLWIHVL
ncbi:MAG: recombinase family protein [Ruminococcaceae bacterium]|nr:recombinase family protein [Oscillospiraceae bacterium]